MQYNQPLGKPHPASGWIILANRKCPLTWTSTHFWSEPERISCAHRKKSCTSNSWKMGAKTKVLIFSVEWKYHEGSMTLSYSLPRCTKRYTVHSLQRRGGVPFFVQCNFLYQSQRQKEQLHSPGCETPELIPNPSLSKKIDVAHRTQGLDHYFVF